MRRKGLFVYLSACIALIVAGILIFSFCAYPYISNSVHEKIPPIVKYHVLSDEKCHVYIKFETLDGFIANNPINATVIAKPINVGKIQSIRLTFEGATEYFPDYPNNQTFQDLFNIFKSANANILTILTDSQYDTITFENQVYSRFTGKLENLTYANAGSYDVYLQFNTKNGTVYGYGTTSNTTQNSQYIVREALTVSPPENMLQIKSNNIMVGLGWIALSLTLILAGLVGLLEVIKNFVFNGNQPFTCITSAKLDSK